MKFSPRRLRKSIVLSTGLTLALVTSLAGCARQQTAEAKDVGDTLVVLAASSLATSFESLGRDFEATHPDVEVQFSFGSSTTLAEQLVNGAPGDVLATADSQAMAIAQNELVANPDAFATNSLALLIPADNPGRIESVADLDNPGIAYVACVNTAPCGALAKTALADLGVERQPVSFEMDAAATIARVASGDVDAGFAYVTDAVTSPELRSVDLPKDYSTTYYISKTQEGTNSELADEFLELVLGAGQDTLTEAGFGAP